MLKDDTKEYLVQVNIIEARHLTGKNDNGMSNPFVKIKCAYLPVQSSETVFDCLTPVWNQSFSFINLKLNHQEFETSELTFYVYSRNRFSGNDLIGQYAIGLSTLYKNANHEFFNVWLTLSNSDNPDESQGYLLVDCFIIGAGDKPPAHSVNDKVNQDVEDDDEEVNIDSMTFDQLKAYQEKKLGIQILGKPSIARKSFQLSCYIFKGEFISNFRGPFGDEKPSPFISARVMGLVQKTKSVMSNNSPVFNQKMLFPCYYPILNDKILLRMWNYKSSGTDEFIANIPEFSLPNDYFNISKLISIGGRMPAKWINLYCIPPKERNTGFLSNFVKKRHPKEGTAFMGRILISFSLLGNPEPRYSVMPCNPFYEPDTQAYRLFCDIYQIQFLKDFEIVVCCEVTIGPDSTSYNKKKKVNKKNKVEWEAIAFKKNEIALPEILQHYPKDLAQVPDIFVHLYTGDTDNEKDYRRIGYIRLKAEEVIKWEPTPRWIAFKPLDLEKDSPGSALINLQFLIDTENTKRVFKQRGIAKKFILYSYIVQGFEIDPKGGEEDIETFVKIELDEGKTTTNSAKGRFPFWNELKMFEVELDWKLDFTPNVSVTLMKKKKKIFGPDVEEIGTFTIPVRCIKKKKKFPHYFNLVKNNEVVGRIMAMFYIKDISKMRKTAQNNENFLIRDCLEKTRSAKIKTYIHGIRNLDFEVNFKDVELNIDIAANGSTNPKKEIQEFHKINNEEKDDLINIIETYEFDVPIPGDNNFQIFPMMKIALKKDGLLFFNKENYILFNVSEFCSSDVVNERNLKLYRLLFEANMGINTIEQEQIIFWEFDDLIEDEKKGEDDEDQFEDKKEEEGKDPAKEVKKKKVEIKEDNADIRDRLMVEELVKYKNMVVSDVIELTCMHKDKQKEREMKKQLRKSIGKELRELKKKEITTPDEMNRLLELETKIRDLKKPLMTEDMFFGFDDISDEYDYGREVFKEDIYEFHTNMDIPYKKRNLYYVPWGPFLTKCEDMGGYYKLGRESHSFIKFNVNVTFEDETKDDETEHIGKAKQGTKTLDDDDMIERDLLNELKTYTVYNQELIPHIKKLYYNPIERKNIKKTQIFLHMNNVKVRVYIYRCLNLTAQDDYALFVDRVAGYSAFCKANAYLELSICDATDNDGKHIKYVCDKTSVVPNSLNPSFYKYYELDTDLPKGWKLKINVKSQAEGMGGDTLIGSTVIDLEDRYLGDSRNRNLIKAKALEANLIEQLKTIKDKKDQPLINKKIAKINEFIDKLKPVLVPVEFRPLHKPDAAVAQGIIEMFVEVLHLDLAKKIKPTPIVPPQPEEYELRLVIWETRNLPTLGTKKTVDAFIKVSFDPEGWLSEAITKETDTHLGCTDGRAVFNWRMKFLIKVPCTFPRLYFTLYDFNTLSADEAVGECYISLKRIFKRLLQEGKLTIDKKWIPLSSKRDSGEDKGDILISIYLLQKFEADQSPVGEAQEEPNKDPKLDKPTEGRGVLDFLKGTAFDVSSWKFNFDLFGAFKTLAIIGSILMIFVILFVSPGILVK